MGVGAGLIIRIVRGMGLAVQQEEVDFRILILNFVESFLEEVAGANDDLGSLFNSGLDGLNTRFSGILGGTIVSVGVIAAFCEFDNGFPCALVERLVVDVAYVGNESDFIGVLGKGADADEEHGHDKESGKNLLHDVPPDYYIGYNYPITIIISGNTEK